MSPLATGFVQLVYFAVLIVLFIELQLGIDIPSTTKYRQLKQTVYQLNRPIHRGGCRRLGDQNKHTCQEEVTGITELFEARCCRHNENDIPIKDDTGLLNSCTVCVLLRTMALFNFFT